MARLIGRLAAADALKGGYLGLGRVGCRRAASVFSLAGAARGGSGVSLALFLSTTSFDHRIRVPLVPYTPIG